jgi:uncharacterized protein (TIGR02421 family)
MVQVANLAPLRARLERVKGLKVSSPEKGVRIGQDLFGEKVNKEEEKVEKEERPVLGSHETISITSSGSNITIPCRIAPEEEGTIFTQELIEELKKEKVLCSRKKGEQGYKIKFTLHGKRLQTLITEGKIEGSERALIGRRDLTDFLIDPSKTKEKSTKTRRSSVKTDLRAVDRTLAQIDKELLLLKQLKPINLESEKRRIQEDPRYNPLFTYPELSINTEEIMQKLSKKLSDTSPLGILLEKKRRELRTRIKLMEARGSSKEFTRASIALYGKPTNELLKTAFSLLQQKTPEKEISPEKILPAEKAKPIFEEALESYSLHDWDVAIRSHLLSDCAVGGKHIYLREGAQFSLPHVESLIAHEIETHVLTAENGAHQPYAIFRRGCANYLETQEGLAIYNQNQVLPLTHEKRFGPARSALGVAFGLEHSFADLREYLEKELGYTSEKALSKALDIKRGLTDTSEPGAFTKGIVYLQGLKKIEKFVDANGDIKRLYVGKIALEDLEIVEQIPDLQPPLLLPKFLQE